MIRVDIMIALVVSLASFILGWRNLSVPESDLRTLSSAEACALVGGDGGWGMECDLIEDCLFTYEIPCHDVEGVNEAHTAMICSQSFEYDPNVEAGIEECISSPFEFLHCTESGSNWCNIEYVCRWDGELKLCVKGSWVSKVPAPVSCNTEPGLPPE